MDHVVPRIKNHLSRGRLASQAHGMPALAPSCSTALRPQSILLGNQASELMRTQLWFVA